MAKQYKSLHPLKYYRDHLTHNFRPDGRKFDIIRPVIINARPISTADGSAVVKIGQTTVICGIKAELAVPKPEASECGYILPNLELPPICSTKFKPGPPSEMAQACSKYIADIIQESECIDLKDLCIVKDKWVWCLYVDMVCLNYDGSCVDAALLALTTALKTVKLPGIEYTAELDYKRVKVEDSKPLNVPFTPVSTTFAFFKNRILIDPTLEEENLCSGMMTVIILDDKVCSVLKPGGEPLEDSKYHECINAAIKRSKLINKLIDCSVQESNDDENMFLQC